MKICEKCREYELGFKRPYEVVEFLEGYPDSPIWIIGLNPKKETDWEDHPRSADDLASTFHDLSRKNSYFRSFARVSEWLYSHLGKRGGVAHTDLVKCSSLLWPPPKCSGRDAAKIVGNCSPFLREQLVRFKPRMLICNGSAVSSYISKVIPPLDLKPIGNRATYCGDLDGKEIWVVLSGFIRRLDNYTLRRLGAEIELIAERIGVKEDLTNAPLRP